jgi:2-hydroxyacyl-CoA lyase 1
MAQVSGADILAQALKNEGVDTIFNLPGDPMGSIYPAVRREEMRIFSFRHEQAAAMAAQAYAYTTRKVGLALVPSGPGMTNAITGLTTAWANCWPVLLIGGNGESGRRHRGDFQEAPQVEAAEPFCKWSVAVDDPRQIPYYVNSAVRKMMNGRPAPVYLDLPSNVISGHADEEEVAYLPTVPPPTRPMADSQSVSQAAKLLADAERPLLLVGKGVAWSDAAEEARQLVDRLRLPFVPSPMGKGVVPDDHPLNVQAARTFALQNADVVLLAGARFNWIFHFGQPPRFSPNVKVVQLDIDSSEIGNGAPATVGLVGDAKAVFQQLLDEVGEKDRPIETPWLQELETQRQKNADSIASMVNSEEAPMNMYRMYRDIRDVLGRDAIVTADGENNMAVSRVMMPNYLPRHRLDAGVSGCMGVAVPYAIGAQVARPGSRVASLNGDFAFGWNGFEIETAIRYDLPIVFIVANNVSVGGPQHMELGGSTPDVLGQPEGIRYDKVMEAFGGHAEHVETPQQLRPALERALAAGKPSLVNVVISKGMQRKQQSFDWMSGRSERMRYE